MSGCTSSSTQTPSPIQDIDLDLIHSKAKEIDGLKSLLISEDDSLTFAQYYVPYGKDSLDHVRSVTKSIVSILIGIAIDKGFIEDPYTPIHTYLASMKGFDEKHKNITLHHLLNMTSGIQWNESNVSEFNNWVSSRDPIKYVLDRNVKNKPGQSFSYNSAGSHLLSVILTESTGMTAEEFGNRFLFDPLEINVRWQRLGKYSNGGAGLELRPRDMIKIGQLIANKGIHNNQRLISQEWIEASTTTQIKLGQSTTSYGYQWWLEDQVEDKVCMAMGFAGQFIVVFKEMEHVIVATSLWRGRKGKTDKQQSQIINLISKFIYPYLKDKTS